MKAKVNSTNFYTPKLSVGEIVEIVPGFETDAEGIWNAAAGKLVLVRKDDGTHCYVCPLDIQIIGSDTDDWEPYRREAAKDLMCTLLQNGKMLAAHPYDWFCDKAIELADNLIKQLKEKRGKN